ncbi:hypothetical protein SLA2020_370870 [Shorea laevis]
MELVGPIIEIVKFVGGPIVGYLKYQIKFNDHLEQFKISKQGLCSRMHDIESRLEEELHYGQVAKEEVQIWLKGVKEFITREDVENEVNSWGCLSCCCRVKILEERAKELKEIYDQGDRYTNDCLVGEDPSASALELQTTKLQGSADVKAKILACLKREEVTKLGVWGMGGVGKTTIMMHVHNELLKEANPKRVIWLNVSQSFDIYKLQEQIASNLNEKLPSQRSIVTRAAMLSKMLRKHRPYLLILDDVWRSFELEAVGIPIIDDCKLVLTTRSQEIARTMGCEIIKVKTLSQSDALKLFLDKVGDIVLADHGCIKGTLESAFNIEGIVGECGGLPLAIVTVAGSLKGIFEPQLWSAALNQLKDCKRNVAGIDDDDAFGILKFSYDRLRNPKIQHCFLYCAFYPEDYNIPTRRLIEYWIDEGLIAEMGTLQAMVDEGHDILRKLEDNCLLEFTKIKGQVRMHDLVRDMALHIIRTSHQFLVEPGKALIELPEKGRWTKDLEKVSLIHNSIEEIPSSILSSKCTMLTTLLLSRNKLSTIPESIFENMPELKILDLSFNPKLRSLPSSISKLVNLTVLLLRETSLRRVPSLSDLRALKKLDLGGTKIKEVPKGLEMCTNLKYLDLSDLSDLWGVNVVVDAILSNLFKLQQLFVNKSIALTGKVIGRLKKLEAFSGWFPTVHDMSFFVKCFHDQGDGLGRYSFTVGNSSSLYQSNYDQVMGFSGINIVGENILLPSVQELCIESCDNLRSLNDFSSIKDVTDLRECRIDMCQGMKCVFSWWINPLIQTLEHLKLYELDNLETLFEADAIAKSPSPPSTFSSLKSISLERCGKIIQLIPSWKLLEYLPNLEDIFVYDCKQMEEIIALDLEEGEEEGDIIKLILPKLKYLRLSYLPALKSICNRRAVMVCDSLEQIEIWDCEDLRRIPLKFPLLDNGQPSLPPSLKTIEVFPNELWESLEWDHPNAKDVLPPLLSFLIDHQNGNNQSQNHGIIQKIEG